MPDGSCARVTKVTSMSAAGRYESESEMHAHETYAFQRSSRKIVIKIKIILRL